MALAALKPLTVAVSGALIALILYAGEPKEFWWWLVAIPFTCWIVGPAIVPYLIAQRFADRRWFVWTMLTFLMLSTVWAGPIYYQAFFVSKSSTAALVMLFGPLYQWIALGCTGLVCACVIGWLNRRDSSWP